MKAIVDIPEGEPGAGQCILSLETPPQIGHWVADTEGNLYEIKRVIHLIETNKESKHPHLKLIVERVHK
jgi:hypothetical protein